MQTTKLKLEDFPAVCFDAYEKGVEASIASYLNMVLEDNGNGRPECEIEMPSILDMSMFLHCHEFDVLDTLNVLKQKGFEYEVRDFYSPVRIRHRPGPMLQVRSNLLGKVQKLMNAVLNTPETTNNTRVAP